MGVEMEKSLLAYTNFYNIFTILPTKATTITCGFFFFQFYQFYFLVHSFSKDYSGKLAR